MEGTVTTESVDERAMALSFDMSTLPILFEHPKFQKWYIYNTIAVVRGLQFVLDSASNRLKFVNANGEFSLYSGIGHDMIDAQNEECGHSGFSAGQTLRIVMELLNDGTIDGLLEKLGE